MKEALVFGAGSVGRGLLGHLLFLSGYEIVFADIRKDLIEDLNRRRSYLLTLVDWRLTGDPLEITQGELVEEKILISSLRAISSECKESVLKEVRRAQVIFTCAGARALPAIAQVLAPALARREQPVNLILCENIPDPAQELRQLLLRENPSLEGLLGQRVGLVPAVVGRMIPLPEEEQEDPLALRAEPYPFLPVDAEALISPIPSLTGLTPTAPFAVAVQRKLFLHNGPHSIAAYLGYQKGYRYIHEAVWDEGIRQTVWEAMQEASLALQRTYSLDPRDEEAYCKDLLRRFANPGLKDTVLRVGRDPWRKLGSQERLIGGARMALNQGIPPKAILKGIKSALAYDPPTDEYAQELQKLLREGGVPLVLQRVCGLSPEEPLYKLLIAAN